MRKAFLIYILTFVSILSLKAQPCLNDWTYRVPLEIENISTSALNSFQVLVYLNTQNLIAAGKLKADASDLRFTSSTGTNIPYWINESTINTASTEIWLKLSLPALSTTTFYIFYGNPSAIPASNGNNTFILFDDFNGSTVNTSLWSLSCNDGDIDVSGGNIKFTTIAGQQACISSQAAWNPTTTPILTEADITSIDGGGLFIGQMKTDKNGFGFYFDGTDKKIVKTSTGTPCFTFSDVFSTGCTAAPGICSMGWTGSANQIINAFGAGASSVDNSYSLGNIYSVIGNTDIDGSVEIDWIRTRKYIQLSLTPIATVLYASEDVLPTSDATQIHTNAPVCSGEELQLWVENIPGATYSWQFPVFETQTGNSVTIPNSNLIHNGTFTLTISSPSSGCSNIVSTAVVVVNLPTNAGEITGSDQVCSDTNEGTLQIINETGNVLRWEYSLTGSSPWAIISNTTDSLQYGNLLQDTYFRAIVQNGACNTEISDTALINVDSQTISGNLIGSNEHCLGENSGTLSILGNNGSIQKWQNSNDNISWIDISNTGNQHTYNNLTDTTYYRAIIQNGVCSSDTTNIASVIINPLPIVDFSSNIVNLGNPTHFTNSSSIVSGSITNYNWDFTTGEGSSVTNPVYEFGAAGSFDVLLQATSNKSCLDSIRKTVIVNSVPLIDFSFTNTCSGDTAFFTNQTVYAGSISYQWDFGDNSQIETSENPFHIYSTSGEYFVKLIINTGTVIDSLVKQIVIYPRAVPDFAAENVCDGVPVIFSNNTILTSGGISYIWNFGDSGSSNQINPQHLYSTNGEYSIELIATTNFGCSDTIVKNIMVYRQPVAEFSFIPNCAGFPASFTDNSHYTNNDLIDTLNTAYHWTFGDGNSSINTNPVNTYSSYGFYNVNLQLTTSDGCISSISQSIESFPIPQANYNFSDACFGEIIDFQNTSSVIYGNIEATWDFNDGQFSEENNPLHLFSSAGNYEVQLIITTDKSCSDTIVKTVNLFPNPIAVFSAQNVCNGEPTSFTNLSTVESPLVITSYSWDFDNGTNSVQENPVVQFLNPGTYNVSLIVQSSNGCQDTITNQVIVDNFPTASFSFEDVCLNSNAVFLNSSTLTNGTLTYEWSFGDGSYSVLTNPEHLYATAGTYPVKLKAKSQNNCTDSIYESITVFELPNANAGTDTVVSLGNSLILNGSGGIAYSWFPFDVLDDAYTPTPLAQPLQSTDFVLRVEDNNGCRNYDTVRIEVSGDFNLIISNVITPDDNGENDYWQIDNLENYPDSEVFIFDRWGTEIYSEKAYKNTWNGVNKSGDILPDGTYYYLIKSESSTKIYKGAITILRNK